MHIPLFIYSVLFCFVFKKINKHQYIIAHLEVRAETQYQMQKRKYKSLYNELFLFLYRAERQEKQPSVIKANAVPINITWLYLAELCTTHEKTQKESEGLKERKNRGSTEERKKREMHIKSILELVNNKGINKYSKVDVRPFKKLLNTPGNG